MRKAYIYDAVRTPRGKGKKDGSLHEVKPIDLVKTLLLALRERNHFDAAAIDDVVLGCVTQIGDQGANIARVAALYAGYDQSVPGMTLNRFCASGLEAVNIAAMKIISGQGELVIAGGVESMSRVAMGSDGGAMVLDSMVNGGISFVPQGVSADLVATIEGFSRTDVDSFALESHKKAAAARTAGYFDRSIVPIKDLNDLMILDHDETIREDASLEALGKLKASFAAMGAMGFDATALARYPTVETINHIHHAGNSSGIVDGAGLVLVGSEGIGKKLGLRPRAFIRSAAVVGSEPTIMLTGPTPASEKALRRAGLTASDIDLFEINEAFAAVVLKTQRELNIDPAKVNVNGGAIAMGHPIGATGAILLGTVLDELERTDARLGLITLCVGAGMGIAMTIERV